MADFAALDRSEGPLYRQVAARLRAAISDGTLPVGAELPREAELAEQFGVSLITIRHALRELQGEGLIRKRAAKAAIVTSAERTVAPAIDLNSLSDIAAATRDASLEIASYMPRRSAEAARVFGLDSRIFFPCLRARMIRADEAFSDITIYFPPDIGRRMVRADFDDVVVFRSVERKLGVRLAGARVTVSATVADAMLARRLDYVIGGAVLVNRMVYLDAGGRAIEFTIAAHRADRYRFSFEFKGTQ